MKNQCSAPYVYAKEDLRLEHALGEIETAYARALRKVIAGERPTGEDIGYLLAFMMLQFSRTMAAMERLRSMITGMEREIRSSTTGRLPQVDTSARAMMLSSLRLYETVVPAVLDLRLCFLRNKSRVDSYLKPSDGLPEGGAPMTRLASTSLPQNTIYSQIAQFC